MSEISITISNDVISKLTSHLTSDVDNLIKKTGYQIEADAKHQCPVDTGNLRASIHTEVNQVEHAVEVGTNVEYASYVNYGTIKQPAQPFLTSAFEVNKIRLKKELEKIIRSY